MALLAQRMKKRQSGGKGVKGGDEGSFPQGRLAIRGGEEKERLDKTDLCEQRKPGENYVIMTVRRG